MKKKSADGARLKKMRLDNIIKKTDLRQNDLLGRLSFMAKSGAAGSRLPIWAHALGLVLIVMGATLLFGWGTQLYSVAAVIGAFLLLGAGVFIGWQILEIQRTHKSLNRELLMTAIEAPRTAIAITDAGGKLICANSHYGRLVGGFPSPLRLPVDADGEALIATVASDARVCGSGEGDIAYMQDGDMRQGRLMARRSQRLDRFLVWELQPQQTVSVLDQVSAPAMQLFGPWLDKLKLGLLIADAQDRLIYSNDTLLDWVGLDRRALENCTLSELVSVQPGEGPQLRHGDGSPLPVSIEEIPLGVEDASAEPAGMIEIISLRGPAAAAQGLPQDDGASLIPGQVFTEVPIGVAIVDAEGDILRVNNVLKSLARIEKEAADLNIYNEVVEGDRQGLRKLVVSVLEHKVKKAEMDVRFNAAPDNVTHIIARPVQSGAHEALLYVKDTTEQKKLEQQFAQAQKMQAVGQLAGGIAHDFNNILTAIIGFCDLLLVRHGAGDASFSDIMQIKQNANRAANLVRQLLAFSRKQTLRPSVIDITDALAELSNLLRRLIGENIELKMVHGRNIEPVRVDQGQLEQVIINLAVNARDAMHEGGALTISTAMIGPQDVRKLGHSVMPPADYVAIAVKDTGSGIPDHVLPKIFEPFFTTKEVGKGTGLGLSTVYGIVKQTGGFIFASSPAGEGATFTIYLPVHQAEAKPAAPVKPVAEAKPEPVADLWGRGTILLVEDEDAVRTFAYRALTKKGYTVLEAASGEAALGIVKKHEGKLDLLISDVVMPNMDGPTLAAKVRELLPGIKIIFISGYAQDDFRNSVAEGEYSFLPKPFSLTALAEKVKQVLADED